MTRIYLSPPDVGAEERRMLLEAFDSNWIAPLGPGRRRLRARAGRTGRGRARRRPVQRDRRPPPGLLLRRGRPRRRGAGAVLHLRGHGHAVSYLGANPVFVDCSPSTWNIDPDLVADELAARARAGPAPRARWSPSTSTASPPTTTPSWPLCDSYGVPLVEDAAEALGRHLPGPRRPDRSDAPASSRSTATRSSPPAAAACWCPTRPSWSTGPATWPPRPASRSPTTSTRRSASTTGSATSWPPWAGPSCAASTAASTAAGPSTGPTGPASADLPGIEFMPVADYGEPNYWLTCILVDPDRFGADREQIRLALEAEDIESRPTWKPLHLQPVFAGATHGRRARPAPRIFERGLCLPTGSALTDDDLSRVVETILAAAPLAGPGPLRPDPAADGDSGLCAADAHAGRSYHWRMASKGAAVDRGRRSQGPGLLPPPVPPHPRERRVVGQGVHRVDQRDQGPTPLPGALPTPRARRARLLRPAGPRGPRGPGRAGRRPRHLRVRLLPLLVPREAPARAARSTRCWPRARRTSPSPCAGPTRSGPATGTPAPAGCSCPRSSATRTTWPTSGGWPPPSPTTATSRSTAGR